jgi:hypothetical protein
MLPNQVDDRILAAVGGHGVLPKYYLRLRRAKTKFDVAIGGVRL